MTALTNLCSAIEECTIGTVRYRQTLLVTWWLIACVIAHTTSLISIYYRVLPAFDAVSINNYVVCGIAHTVFCVGEVCERSGARAGDTILIQIHSRYRTDTLLAHTVKCCIQSASRDCLAYFGRAFGLIGIRVADASGCSGVRGRVRPTDCVDFVYEIRI